MADIQTDLNTIATGKYGKDVRKAIHDAIETCYSDGKVGAIDLTARNQIAQLVTSGNKELTEQTLWSGSIYGTGASLTLSSAIGNFDYLDIYVTKEGNTSIHTIPAVRSTYNIRESNLPDDGAAAFSISEAGINFPDTTTLAIYKQSYFARSSSGVDSGKIVNPTDTDSQSNLHIIKVIGRKSVANTEVTDIRNPADGMTEPTGGYSTAGDAVRGQVLELKGQIDQIGDLSLLETETKTDLVSAINEAAENDGFDLSDLTMNAVQSQTEGFSTLTLSDGETSKTVDIPVASLSDSDVTLLTNIANAYLENLISGDEVNY